MDKKDFSDVDFSYQEAIAVAEIDDAIEDTDYFRVGKYFYKQEWFEGDNPEWAFNEHGVPFKIEK